MWKFGLQVPATLQKRLVKFLLKRTLGKFLLNELQLDQLDVSIGVSGTLVLRDLELNVHELNIALADTPLAVRAGSVATVRIMIPWLDLNQACCELDIDGVVLVVVPRASPATPTTPGSATGAQSQLHDLTNSIYIANEFLKRDAAESAAAKRQRRGPGAGSSGTPSATSSDDDALLDEDDGEAARRRRAPPPSTSTSASAPLSMPMPGGVGGDWDIEGSTYGVHMLANVVDTILGNLRFTVRNVSLELEAGSSQGPNLQLVVPEITSAAAEQPPGPAPLGEEAGAVRPHSRIVQVPSFHVQTRAGGDVATHRASRLLWSVGTTALHMTQLSPDAPISVQVDSAGAICALWPDELVTLQRIQEVFLAGFSLAGATSGGGGAGYPRSSSSSLSSSSSSARGNTSSDRLVAAGVSRHADVSSRHQGSRPLFEAADLSNDEDDEPPPHAKTGSAMERTVFYSAMVESVLLPERDSGIKTPGAEARAQAGRSEFTTPPLSFTPATGDSAHISGVIRGITCYVSLKPSSSNRQVERLQLADGKVPSVRLRVAQARIEGPAVLAFQTVTVDMITHEEGEGLLLSGVEHMHRLFHAPKARLNMATHTLDVPQAEAMGTLLVIPHLEALGNLLKVDAADLPAPPSSMSDIELSSAPCLMGEFGMMGSPGFGMNMQVSSPMFRPPGPPFAVTVAHLAVAWHANPTTTYSLRAAKVRIESNLRCVVNGGFSVALNGLQMVASESSHEFTLTSVPPPQLEAHGFALSGTTSKRNGKPKYLVWSGARVEVTIDQRMLGFLNTAAAVGPGGPPTSAAQASGASSLPILTMVMEDVSLRIPELDLRVDVASAFLTAREPCYSLLASRIVGRQGDRLLFHHRDQKRPLACHSRDGEMHYATIQAVTYHAHASDANLVEALRQFFTFPATVATRPSSPTFHATVKDVSVTLEPEGEPWQCSLDLEHADMRLQKGSMASAVHVARVVMNRDQIALTCENLDVQFVDLLRDHSTVISPRKLFLSHPLVHIRMLPETVNALLQMVEWVRAHLPQSPGPSSTAETEAVSKAAAIEAARREELLDEEFVSPASDCLPDSPTSSDLMGSVDDDAFASTALPTEYDLNNLSISVVEDFAVFEEELGQMVMVDPEVNSSDESPEDMSAASSFSALDIVDDHFAEGATAATPSTAANGGRSIPAEEATACLGHYAVQKAMVIVHIETPRRNDESPDTRHKVIDIECTNVHLERHVYDSTSPREEMTVSVEAFDIVDHIVSSNWNKLLSRYRTGPLGASASNLPFAKIDAMVVGDGEYRVKVRVQPIKMHVDQDTATALLDFGRDVIALGPYEIIDTPSPSKANVASDKGSRASVPPPPPSTDPFIQRFEVLPIKLRLDYKPKHVDISTLKSGNVVELLNLFHLEGAEMNLRHVIVTGVRGWRELAEAVLSDWLPHIRNTQLPNMVSGVGPLRSLVNIGTGVADLILLPVEQYRRDGRVIKGLQRGAHNFVKTAALETLHLGSKLAVGTHSLLQRADDLLGPKGVPIPGAPGGSTFDPQTTGEHRASGTPTSQPLRASPGHRQRSKYAQQPRDAREGMEQALRSLSQNMSQAVRVIAMPVETMERDGATGAMRAVIRAVPIAVLKPMLGTTDAISKTLMGIRNSVDPARQQELQDVRTPSTLSNDGLTNLHT